MKIHFGGSIPALKKKPQIYKEIKAIILKHGDQIARDWIIEEERGVKLTLEQMYEKTLKAIKVSDAMVLECSDDISAIGQQMELAFENNIPVLLLFPENTRSGLGNFIPKEQQKKVQKSFYNNETLAIIIKEFLEWAEENSKFVRFNLVLERELDQYLKNKAKKNHTSKTEEIRKLILNDMPI